MPSDGSVKPENRKKQITVRQDLAHHEYIIVRLINITWANINVIVTREQLSEYIEEGIEVIIE